MKRNMLMMSLGAAVLSLVVWRTGPVLGDNRPGVSASFDARVALVDLAYIFKKYDKFTRLSDEMKKDVQTREKEITQAQTELKELLNKRNSFQPDSPNYKANDASIAKKKAELELMTDGARREFTQREANLYHQTYQEVELAVRKYSEEHNLTLVLRASRDPESGPTNPQDVVKEVSQQVIYALPHMDITEDILDMLKRTGTPTVGPARGQPNAPARGPTIQPVKPQQPQRDTQGPQKSIKR